MGSRENSEVLLNWIGASACAAMVCGSVERARGLFLRSACHADSNVPQHARAIQHCDRTIGNKTSRGVESAREFASKIDEEMLCVLACLISAPVQELALDSSEIAKPVSLSFGCSEIDRALCASRILRPGRGDLLEIAGDAGSGKTQLCIQLAISSVVQYPFQKVLFLTSHTSFPSERVLEFARHFGAEIEERDPQDPSLLANAIASRVLLRACRSASDLVVLLSSSGFSQLCKHEKVCALVVDSITPMIQTDEDRGTTDEFTVSAARAQARTKVLEVSKRVALEESLAVVFVNQVVAGSASFESRWNPSVLENDLTPALGMTWASGISTHIFTRRNRSGDQAHTAMLTKSEFARAPGEIVSLKITKGRIEGATTAPPDS
mmetsp:Transcript_11238/g.24185  ORF Transcript_11238/g.24185 Transcript_11238/m.24185 type:complete len:380 (+) Transcript_11238:1972-3111(+)